MVDKTSTLFLLSSKGNKLAYNELYYWFVNFGEAICFNYAKRKGISDIQREDLRVQLGEEFLQVIRFYENTNIPFSKYASAILNKRACKIIANATKNHNTSSLDEPTKNGMPLLEIIPSEDFEKMNNEIEYNMNKQIIASKSFGKKKINKRLKKLIYYKECGFRKAEIMSFLNISDGQYRYLLRLLNDDSTNNLKIEMK